MKIDTLKKICNKNILNILELLEKEGEKSISQIKRALNLEYRNAWRYCRKLYDMKLVLLDPIPEKNSQGKLVMVKLKNDK